MGYIAKMTGFLPGYQTKVPTLPAGNPGVTHLSLNLLLNEAITIPTPASTAAL